MLPIHMKRPLISAVASLLTVGLLALVLIGIFDSLPEHGNTKENFLSIKGGFSVGSLEGFTRARHVRRFKFPQDHGPHPQYKTEWWYFTGNLSTQDKRRFGYQLTFFRIGLHSDKTTSNSRWRAKQIYMAHLAVSDIYNQKFFHKQRITRDAVDLAGSQSKPFAVWLENWSVRETDSRQEHACRDCLNIDLRAATGDIELSLRLESLKPVVLQGEQGLSRKSEKGGHSSYYYSLTRLETEGRIYINGQNYSVNGLSWLDREWSTMALAQSQSGWDWFALQLSDGRDLMFYQLRDKSGNPESTSSGVLVSQSGSVQHLDHKAVSVRVLESHVNPNSGVRYPAKWRMHLPEHKLTLEITPWIADQELDGIVRYWEGAVKAEGTSDNQPIQALGYVELTGYE